MMNYLAYLFEMIENFLAGKEGFVIYFAVFRTRRSFINAVLVFME